MGEMNARGRGEILREHDGTSQGLGKKKLNILRRSSEEREKQSGPRDDEHQKNKK